MFKGHKNDENHERPPSDSSNLAPGRQKWIPLAVLLVIGLVLAFGSNMLDGETRDLPYSEFKKAPGRRGSSRMQRQFDRSRILL